MIERMHGLPSLTLVHLTAIDASPLELISAAATCDFASVALRVCSPACDDRITPVVGNDKLVRKIVALSADLGIGIPYVDGAWMDGETQVNDLALPFETAARIGARKFIVVGMDAERARLLDTFGRACELANDFGLSLVIEFIPYSEVKTLGDAVTVVRDCSMSNAGVAVDSLHLVRSGGTALDIRQVDPAVISIFQLSDAAALTRHVDVAELRHEARTSRRYAGHGALPLTDIVNSLPRSLSIDVEIPHAAHAHLPVVDRARLAADTTLAFLTRINAHNAC